MSRFQWPWAKRNHSHFNPDLFAYDTCYRCGHVIRSGHVSVAHVRVQSGGLGGGFSCGASCAPNYDAIHIAVDGRAAYYLNSKRVYKPNWIPDLSTWQRRDALDDE